MISESISAVAERPPVKAKIDIQAMIKTKLPPLPGSTMRILDLLRDYNTSTKKLADAVECDPSLVARLLRLANSPIYALQKNVNSIYQAIDVIGTKSLYDIVMMGMTSDVFAKEIRSSVLGRTIWEHSLAVALLAREFSRMLGMRGTDEVFICGLLHDIGKIMLLRADVETYSQILDKKGENEMLNWEHETFGYNHAQIGALVVQGWRLPEVVCQSILNHHNASQSVQSLFISHLINVADIVANYNGYGLRLGEESDLLNSESAILLHLSQENLHTAWENIQDSLEEVTGTF
jgi:putative nucleotidyltransferase with HDIG domain